MVSLLLRNLALAFNCSMFGVKWHPHLFHPVVHMTMIEGPRTVYHKGKAFPHALKNQRI